ncbi:hypothetical protein SLOPH_2600 [Spraguea lophii 42_110]|uniref:Ca2+-dependent lipid-binding protein n=1 Tax=Spraguea lophii (strain 42_110) TaxID=1358809 RepID=S7W4P1_SPRLO|nr:hypothetical protein SLOPH_2600 [Spraguea lophii 42_110]
MDIDSINSEDIKLEEERISELYNNSKDEVQDALVFESSVKIFHFFRIPLLLLFCVLLGYLSSKMIYSVVFLFLSLYIVYFIINRNIMKYKRSVNDVIFLDLEKERTMNKWEKLQWFNYVVERYWTVFEPMVSNFVLRYLNIIFEESCPSFLSRLRVSEFTLGNISPFIKKVKFLNCAENIVLEFDMGFLPTEDIKSQFLDDSDIQKPRYGSRIVIIARLGSSVKGIGIDVPISVTSVTFKGVLRVEMKLTNDIPFVEVIDLSFLTQPFVDFSIKPLKRIDIRYIPGISNWMTKIIENAFDKLMVAPNSLKLDLTDINAIFGKPIGVICIHILNYSNKNKNNKDYNVEIRLDNKKRFFSKDFKDADTCINEYFFLIIESNDMNIEFILKESSQVENIVATGSIKIGKIKLLNDYKEDIRLFTRGDAEHSLECSFSYYPITQSEKTNSAIIGVEIVEAEDLHGYEFNRKKTYNSFCTLSVSHKSYFDKKPKPKFAINPFNIFKKSFIMIKKALNAPGGFVLDTNFENVESFPYPSSENSLYVNNTKKILDSRSPIFEQPFLFLSRNIQNDVLVVEVKDQNLSNDEIRSLGNIELFIKDIIKKNDIWYKIKNAHGGRIHLRQEKYFIDLEGKNCEFKKFKDIIKVKIIELNTIYDEGEYFIILKNDEDAYHVRGFIVGEFPIQRTVYVPVEENNNLEIYLYKKNLKEDEFIGETKIDIKEMDIYEQEFNLLNENIESVIIKLEITKNKLDNFKSQIHEKQNLKVIQIKFHDIITDLDNEFYLKFYNQNDTLFTSRISYKNKIAQNFTFLTGGLDINCEIKSLKPKNDKTLAKFTLPDKTEKKEFKLKNNISALIETNVKYSEMITPDYFKNAKLKLKIISCTNVKAVDRGSSDTYVRLLQNGIKIYKTKVYERNLDPIFNESTEMTVNLSSDILRFEIKDWNKIMKYELISFIEFPLNFIEGGKIKLSLTLIDAGTLLKCDTKLNIEMEVNPL